MNRIIKNIYGSDWSSYLMFLGNLFRFRCKHYLCMMNQLLPESFYLQDDVLLIARQLLGKILVTRENGIITSGIITETEAYTGETDRASHAFGGRRTKRTETMYLKGGVSYVYLCYGLHCLFNVVTNKQDIPHAILIRRIEPLEGIEEMNRRLTLKKMKPGGNGPAKVSAALGITMEQNRIRLYSEQLRIEDYGIQAPVEKIISSPRIGVDYAGEDALLPYRFFILPQELQIKESPTAKIGSGVLTFNSVNADVTMSGVEATLSHADVTLSGVEGTLIHADVTLSGVEATLIHADVTMSGVEGALSHADVTLSGVEMQTSAGLIKTTSISQTRNDNKNPLSNTKKSPLKTRRKHSS